MGRNDKGDIVEAGMRIETMNDNFDDVTITIGSGRNNESQARTAWSHR